MRDVDRVQAEYDAYRQQAEAKIADLQTALNLAGTPALETTTFTSAGEEPPPLDLPPAPEPLPVEPGPDLPPVEIPPDVPPPAEDKEP